MALVVATLATGAAAGPLEAYAAAWATPGDASRCGGGDDCAWMAGFGAIDAGCTFDVASVGLAAAGAAPRGPALRFALANGSAFFAAPASGGGRFRSRPAVCEYAGGNGTGDAALLVVANSAGYLFRLWPLFLNKLLYASDAGLRPFLWIGELPPALERADKPACLASKPARDAKREPPPRELLESFYDGVRHGGAKRAEDVTWVSNHYIKVPAVLATLAHPTVAGAYYVDLDAVTPWPWSPPATTLAVHAAGFSDVSFKHSRETTLWWRVHGSRFYARDAPFGRSFFAAWFANRCSFKDQYALWHTVLEAAGAHGCVAYGGELWRDLAYDDARKMTRGDAAARFPGSMALPCQAMRDACPHFRYCDDGGDRHREQPIVDEIFHHSIDARDPRARTFAFRGPAGDAALDVEDAYLVAGAEDRAGSNADYLAALGILDRDRTRHAWDGAVR
jgi:hypothetical protein